MSTTRHGITNHELVESFERLHKHLKQLGYSEQESTRGAMALTFALSGEFSREQAWQAADDVVKLIPHTPTDH